MGHELGVHARALIHLLSAQRVAELAEELGLALPSGSKQVRAEGLAAAVQDVEPVEFFGRLRRDELRAACKSRGLAVNGRSRAELTSRLLGQAIDPDSVAAWFRPWHALPELAANRPPKPGQIVCVRQRQYLVEAVVEREREGDHSLVTLLALDDDDAGRVLQVFWELELDATVIVPEEHGLGRVDALDSPRLFSAYFHALAWGCTTATDARLFQAPFRAGIRLARHQLVPLRKALQLPRVNLFIADDVGVGKTIEAGLVVQELLLRQQLDRILVVCPAAVTTQWREELERRFGLRFEIYDRRLIARRREERGFGVNVWGTYPRFIVSYQTLRRPEHWEPLLASFESGTRRSLLLLDEAHTAAPASASKYAVDSDITKAIRELAPRFEHRLFLSATPHNGHSSSFSSLLELLDPQRFTRGVPVEPSRLAPVMVRRLKPDLIKRGITGYPERRVRQIDLKIDGGRWWQEVSDNGEGKQRVSREDLGTGIDVELELARLLAVYRRQLDCQNRRTQIVLINLQKRLLSSVEAFYRTLSLHARSLGLSDEASSTTNAAKRSSTWPVAPTSLFDDGEDRDDDDRETEEDAVIETASRTLPRMSREARRTLDDLLRLAAKARGIASPKVLALLAWIRRHQCGGVALGGAESGRPLSWGPKRVIVFTEYVDTKRHLKQLLSAAFDGTDQGDERILELHGGLPDDRREEITRAFNGDPTRFPVRILLATDAAREGLNLHGRCADLFHYDIPWNPARLEQRNGRIDRALQPEKEVRCLYFFFSQRPEDVVLRTLVSKTETIQRELGSLGTVVLDRLATTLDRGIDEQTVSRIAETEPSQRERTGAAELGSSVLADARDEEVVGEILNDSQRLLGYAPSLLKGVVDAGLELAGFAPLVACSTADARAASIERAFRLPDIDPNGPWGPTLDTLRPARGRDEPFWEWRQRPLKPVVFEAPHELTDSVVQLHLQHPLVQRLLSRFRAQGWAAHDLARVTAVQTSEDHLARVVAIGRLSLFGPGAIRLHDELICVAARWSEGQSGARLRPFAEQADRKAIEQLHRLLAEAPAKTRINAALTNRLLEAAPGDFAALWPEIQAEADVRQQEAVKKLRRRGQDESAALKTILSEQRRAIERALADKQLRLSFTEAEATQKDQLEADRRHMSSRLARLSEEEPKEIASIQGRYEVVLKRLEVVGLVYLCPEAA